MFLFRKMVHFGRGFFFHNSLLIRNCHSTVADPNIPRWTSSTQSGKWTILVHFGLANAKIHFGIKDHFGPLRCNTTSSRRGGMKEGEMGERGRGPYGLALVQHVYLGPGRIPLRRNGRKKHISGLRHPNKLFWGKESRYSVQGNSCLQKK